MPRLALLLLLAAPGCAGLPRCDRLVGAARDAPAAEPVALGLEPYRLGCADVVAVEFAGRPEWDCLASVAVDGRLPLPAAADPPPEPLVVEGATLGEVQSALARAAGADPGAVGVRLAEARSGRVYLVGPENRTQRMVPFEGPEPALEFLKRAGALRPGCTELREVTVTRPNVAAGGRPETVAVDVEAILAGDAASNVVLQANDVVTVGETRRSSFARLLPGWSRPGYRKLVGLVP